MRKREDRFKSIYLDVPSTVMVFVGSDSALCKPKRSDGWKLTIQPHDATKNSASRLHLVSILEAAGKRPTLTTGLKDVESSVSSKRGIS